MSLDEPARRVGQGIGHLFGALSVNAFTDAASFRARVYDLFRTMRATVPAEGSNGPLIPGDPERTAAACNRVAGVPISESIAGDLRKLAQELGIRFP